MSYVVDSRAPRLSWGSLCLLLLAGCGPTAEEPEPAIAVTDAPKTMPAPISVPAQAPPAERPEDPLDRIRERFSEIGADALLVVQARVQAVAASSRTFPKELYWGQAPRLATTLTLEVLQTLCGSPVKEVRVTYPGGRLPDGQFERTELMPRDPGVGEEYIFFLRQIDREYFLDLGRNDMLTKDASGLYLDPVGNRIPLDKIRGLCP